MCVPVASSLQSLSHLRCCTGIEYAQVLYMGYGELRGSRGAAEESKMRMVKGEDSNSPRLEKGPKLFPSEPVHITVLVGITCRRKALVVE